MDDLAVRVLHAWMNHGLVKFIARENGISVAEVERIVLRAVVVPSGRLGL